MAWKNRFDFALIFSDQQNESTKKWKYKKMKVQKKTKWEYKKINRKRKYQKWQKRKRNIKIYKENKKKKKPKQKELVGDWRSLQQTREKAIVWESYLQ